MPRSQTLIIDGQLPSLNTYICAERSSLHAAAALKRNATYKVCVLAREAGLKKVSRPVRIVMRWFVPDRRTDPDNVIHAKKYVLDGLVAAGVLPNDGMAWVHVLEDRLAVDREHPRIEVVIYELNESKEGT